MKRNAETFPFRGYKYFISCIMFFKNRCIMEINFDHWTPFLLEFLSYLSIILWQYHSNFPKNKFQCKYSTK